jgi:glucose/arabinose dehydrogenase
MKSKILTLTATAALGTLAAATLQVSAAQMAPQSAGAPGAGLGIVGSTGGMCPGDNGGISLPPGFCATVFADDLGHVRHIAVAPDGVVYANIWSGRYYPGGKVPADGFLVALKDSRGTGVADKVVRFGETAAEGAAGGTGIAIWHGHLYAEVNDRIVRYALTPGTLAPTGKAQTVLSGMPLGGDHPMHPFVISPGGDLFVDMGSATNSCQPKNRYAGVPGATPCVELETRGGIWRYDANTLGQTFSPKARYATGIRNGEGLAFDAGGRLYATQHGRDQLLQNWPALYPDAARATELPSEELLQLREGGDFGWPECYFDGAQNKLVLAPEYGGDGGKAVGVCADKLAPVATFPAHWAPNALAIYTGKAFPDGFKGGAFIAFHGSWNRAPAPQDGYNVVFQPLADGKVAGPFVIFADDFSGGAKDPGHAVHRPMGLAVAPDGALFISDDVKGRIWRVTWKGPPAAGRMAVVKAAAAAPPVVAAAAPAALLPPPGGTAEQVAHGQHLYQTSTCSACHGTDALGTPLGPNLAAAMPLWGDGSPESIRAVIRQGVASPKQYRAPMPAMGGAQLTPAEVNDLSAWIWALRHRPH